MATDQPMRPITPRPNQRPGAALRRALSLRAASAPICWAKDGLSVMLKGRQSLQKPGFQFRHHQSRAVVAHIQTQKLLLNRLVKLSEVSTTDGAAHRHEHVRAGLDQYA